MFYAIQWVRSLVFIVQMYLAMAIMGVLFLPWALLHRDGARHACKTFCQWIRWTAGWMVGLKSEVRGTPPEGEVLVAAKHQSFLDILLIFSALPAGKFIMKRELLYAPILGQYAYRIGCVPVNRGKRGKAIKQMVDDVASGAQNPGQLVIYPQGTRIAPGVKAPYKVGSFALYDQLQQPCVPVAANVGVFWPKRGIYRNPGTAVVEFLDPIAPGQSQREFMTTLQEAVENQSNVLMKEAGFDPDATTDPSA